MRRKKGRPLSDSKKVLKTYRISEQDFEMFQRWCKLNGFTLSQIIRSGISFLMEKGELRTLLKDPELKALAVSLLEQSFKDNKNKEMKKE